MGLVIRAMIRFMTVFISVAPSEPQNLHVEEVTSFSFHICWDEPEYHGSPYLAGYNISYNNKWERFGVVNCFNFNSDCLEWGQSYDITVAAVCESGNKSNATWSSSNLKALTMGKIFILILLLLYFLN